MTQSSEFHAGGWQVKNEPKDQLVRGVLQMRIKELRLKRGMTRIELADIAGIHASAIAHYETGRRTPALHNIKRLVDALDTTSDFLLGLASESFKTQYSRNETLRMLELLPYKWRTHAIAYIRFLFEKYGANQS